MAEILDTDVYNTSEVLLDLQKRFFDEQDEATLNIGLNGFLNAVFAKELSSAIKIAGENANEAFPSRARLEKNILTPALNYGLDGVFATPAYIDIQLAMKEENILALFDSKGTNSIILDKELKFFIGEYEYHFDYDIILSRTTLANNTTVYTAMYDMTLNNPLSDISNPNLLTPYVVNRDGVKYIFIMCRLRQVEHVTIENKILTNNIIDNKSYLFSYENQLAHFSVNAIDDSTTTILNPVFEGTFVEDTSIPYCRYGFANSPNIRITFDNESYSPKMNTKIYTYVRTTHGAECNFEFLSEVSGNFDNTDKYQYNSLEYFFNAVTPSQGGKSRLSNKELKRRIAMEALSRKTLITDDDLNNYFNAYNDEDSRLYFVRKVDNQFMRSFYCYLAAKNESSNVIPTNVINIRLTEDDFDSIQNKETPLNKTLILKQGCIIKYNKEEDGSYIGTIVKDGSVEDAEFLYTVPYKMVVNYSGPFISYYVSVMNDTKSLWFSYINQESPVQFIGTTALWNRGYNENGDTFTLKCKIMQNIAMELGLTTVLKDDDGEITDIESSIMVIAVLKGETGLPYRYSIGEIYDYDEETFASSFKFEFKTQDIINEDNLMRLDDVYLLRSDIKEYGYFPQNTDIDLYICVKFPDGSSYGQYDLSGIVASNLIDGYTVTNKYSIVGGINLFDNFSEIVSSTVVYNDDTYYIRGVPVVEYNYSSVENNIISFIDELKTRKNIIDEILRVLVYQFSIDFKFYNTYGPSRLHTIDSNDSILSKVNLNMVLELSLKKASDSYTKDYIIRDIKNQIEDFYDNGVLHFSNLISSIKESYSNSIEYIELISVNGVPVDNEHRHIFYTDPDSIGDIPEVLCINTDKDGNPDIVINII